MCTVLRPVLGKYLTFESVLLTFQRHLVHKSEKGKELRKKLQASLDLKEIEALELLSHKHVKLNNTSTSLILKNKDICLANDLTKEKIMSHPFLLFERRLSEKIQLLRKLPIALNYTTPLVILAVEKLGIITAKPEETVQKLRKFQNLFNISLKKTFQVLAQKYFLFSKPLKEIEELLQIYSDYNFTKQDIVNDLWVLKYSKNFTLKRLSFIKENGVENIKTWMIRCPEEVLYRHIKRESENRNILGENSVAEYLSQRLNCSETIAKSLIRKHPQLQNKSLSKMNVTIDYLLKEGFTSLQICRIPKILLHSVKTTETRLKQLIALGRRPDSLYILTKSQKQYMQHVDNLIKSARSVNNS
ncbi:hypothetical protein ABEB36_011773 [Hypothenemus hampei]|uniref:Transcription termination factor, mitochondrial n=1 Tax=Hypothenemus hampei TaxID=57062 RepID=A0ABD1E9U4_HYPHA